YRYSGQEQFLVGTAVAGRTRSEFSETVGHFTNTLVMRANFAGASGFLTVLERVRDTVLGAFEHSEYPFQLLVRRMQPDRDLIQSPLFQTMFIFQSLAEDRSWLTHLALRQGGARIQMGQIEAESIAIPDQVANFPLTLVMAEKDGCLHASLEYQTALF